MFCVVEACLVKWRGYNIRCGGGGMQSAEGSTFRRFMK